MGKITFSLRGKILTIATVVIVLAISAVIATSTYISSREYEAALHSRSLAIGRSLTIQFERLLQLGLAVEDITGFEEQCQEVVRAYPGIDIAMVVDPNGEVLFHSEVHATQIPNSLKDVIRARSAEFALAEFEGELYHYAVIPALAPLGEQVASVVVGFSADLISHKLQGMLMSELSIAVPVLVTGLLTLYLALVIFVTRPLGELIGTILRLREAPLDLTRRTTVDSQDELGQLGHAFNGLMDELQNTTVSKTELEQAMAELRRLSEALYEQKERVEVTLRSIGDAVISVDSEMHVSYLNPVAERMLGWSLQDAEGKPLTAVLHLVDSRTRALLPDPFLSSYEVDVRASSDIEAELQHRNGAFIGVDFTASRMHGPLGELAGGVLTLRDVSAERSMSQRLSWEAAHDPLTGLINRREFTSRVESALAITKNSGQHHVVCFLDLDRFKIVNDTAGHAAGDELLQALAQLMNSNTRQSDSFARFGGDEFALLLEGCSMERGQLIANDILSTVENYRFDYKGKLFTVGVSIGLAPVTGEASCADVLSMADTACYLAKEHGRNRVCVYRVGSGEMAARRKEADWVGRINAALAENRFVLYHQTFLDLGAEQEPREHLEVLLRMVDEDGKLVPPANFLPAAERYNLMPTIDRWVIKRVFAAYKQLITERNGQALTCAINLSGTTLNTTGLFDYVKQQYSNYQLPEKSICFEITETAAINNLNSAAEFVNQCKSLGILFALDDFGTGTSSFGYLKNLPVDFLKIDGGFVKNMQADNVDRAMTETINRIGQIMGIRTVAEYAENEDIIRQLRQIGVNFAQGYGVSMPTPLIIEKK